MRYIIDGHNLIPHVPGLSLEMVDDEERLVALLQGFCRDGRHQVEVYFDGTPPEYAGRRQFGAVTAVFVRRGQIADEAIRQRLRQLGARARQWTVVSSDQAVQVAGREAHASVLSSEEFSGRMRLGDQTPLEEEKPGDEPMPPEEVEDWLRLFRSKTQY